MREILFKAKRIDNGEWVEGLIWKKKYNTDKIFISCFPDKDDNEEVFVVDPNTICQYTGLTDKNENKIWENDILKVNSRLFHIHYYKFFAMYMLSGIGHGGGVNGMIVQLKDSEVIGNIFDNTELLEE